MTTRELLRVLADKRTLAGWEELAAGRLRGCRGGWHTAC